jgi:amidase
VIELAEDALTVARERDAERAAGRVRGPLHGIPVLVKDNIATADGMQTTAGSLALVGHPPDRDATVVRQLRASGAVLLGKTNLSEWANYRGTGSSSGWSGRGGLTRNPYVLDRTASGSSSGSAVAAAASLAAVTLGTETDGSILSPAAACGLVGVKPTVGLTSRAGVVPIAHSQDTVGPMARTVTDAALTLGVLVGVDPRDPATAASGGRPVPDYTAGLREDALKGVRLGVPRAGFWGFDDVTDAVTEQALEELRRLGATLVDVELPCLDELRASTAEITVLQSEFKVDLAAYLQALPDRPGTPRTLADLIAFNTAHAAQELPHFGQETFLAAEATEGLDSPAYRQALADDLRLGRQDGVDALLREHDLQALVAPTMGPAARVELAGGERYAGGCTTTVLAIGGYPGVTVPMGWVDELPVGLCLLGTAWSEPALLAYAYAYEQATRHRRPPRYLPTGGPAQGETRDWRQA